MYRDAVGSCYGADMTEATVRLLEANNTLLVECADRAFYLDLDEPARAMRLLIHYLRLWQSRGRITTQDSKLSPEELERLKAEYRDKHKDDLLLEDLKGLGL